MSRRSSRNRLAFGAALAAGLLAGLSVAAFAGSSGLLSGGTAATEERIAPLDAMRVFERPGTTDERVSASGRQGLASISRNEVGVSEDLLPGQADLGEARTLISNAGSSGWTMVAAPTAKGGVCRALLTAQGRYRSGGCINGFTERLPVVPARSRDASGKTVVSGLASDSVVAVAVVVGGVEHPALLTNNAFLFEMARPDGLEAVRATLDDGSKVTIPMFSGTLGVG